MSEINLINYFILYVCICVYIKKNLLRDFSLLLKPAQLRDRNHHTYTITVSDLHPQDNHVVNFHISSHNDSLGNFYIWPTVFPLVKLSQSVLSSEGSTQKCKA